MSRYIDADMVEYFKTFNPDKGKETIADMAWRSDIDAVPTADVVKIVHGEWKGKPIAGYCTVRCSVCGSAFLDNDGRWNYCPNCGADMRGETDEQIH